MKLKCIMLAISFFASTSAAVTVVKMPPPKILTKRLEEAGFEDFAENSDIVKRLAGYWLAKNAVQLRANRAIVSYQEEYGMATQSIPLLMNVLLQDFPSALRRERSVIKFSRSTRPSFESEQE